MKQASLRMLLIGTALIATACSHRQRPQDLPPQPPQSYPPSTQGPGGGQVGNSVVPGSAEDFRQQMGEQDTIHFATDQYSVDDVARGALDHQAAWLRRFPNVHVTIEGHCDERGTREYNLALGDRRANAAKNYLASQGIDPTRMTTISYGKERPVATGSDEGAWAQNRRAVTVVPGGMR
jgi:peptidoglycan-associated lipoprotein